MDASLIAPALGAIDNFYQTSPVEAAALTCGFKATCSDAISQRSANLRDQLTKPFCWSRNRAFMLYGAAYQGCVQHFLYNDVYPRLFGDATTLATVAQKVAFDNLVHVPFLCLPTLYMLKAIVFETPLRDGLDKYVQDAKGDLLWKYWAIWTPAQFFTFSVCPEHLRIPWVALVSFFWLIILSNISSRTEAGPDEAGPDECILSGRS